MSPNRWRHFVWAGAAYGLLGPGVDSSPIGPYKWPTSPVIPIRDLNPRRTTPVVTYALIAINVALFAYEASLGGWLGKILVTKFGIVPIRLMHSSDPSDWLVLFTHMFLHAPPYYENHSQWAAALMHVGGNMWFLHIFGDNLEDNLGKIRYLAFYLLSGLGAAFAQIAIDPFSSSPMIGASGAIAGVLAGYVTLFPRARIQTMIPLIILFPIMEVPAVMFIVVWFGYQLLQGLRSIGFEHGGGGIAFFAHIGGFLAGLVFIRVFRRKKHETYGWRPPGRSPYDWPPRGWD